MQNYQEEINGDKVQLPLFGLIVFYLSAFIVIAAGCAMVWRLNFTDFKYKTINHGIFLNLLPIFMISIAIYSIFLNRQHRRFTFIQCSNSNKEMEKIILNIAKINDWLLIEEDLNYFQFKDRFSWTHWPYNITIIYNNNGFYINSFNQRFTPIDRGQGKKLTNRITDQIKSFL